MLAEGQQLSHYRIVSLLKSGGMGEVYLAVDTHLNRQVAIKVINTDALRYAEIDAAKDAARLFLREARAIAQLDQTNILPLYDSGEQIVDGTSFMFMVMPYRQAGSFADWKRTHFGDYPLPLAAVERIVEQAALALQHAHSRQIIHQDVKPSNFLIQGNADYPDELHLQLADFGVAKAMMMSSESQVIRGTPTYMAPEQWEGHPVPATDQYALAVMAYELLTGQPPFVGNGYQQMWHQHVHIAPRPLSHINPSIPKELDAVMLRALEKNPARRYSSVLAFAHAFQRAVLDGGNVYQTLIISPLEARTGTNRVLPLPNGRQVIVPVPPGVTHGQVIRLEGYGRPATYNHPIGALIVTINIAPVIPIQAASPMTPTFQHTIPAAQSLAPKEIKRTLPPVPHNKRHNKKSTFLHQAITGIAFILILLTALISYKAITKSSGSTTGGNSPNHPFPSYIHIHRPVNASLALYDPLQEENLKLRWVLPPRTCTFSAGVLIARIARDTTTPDHFHNCMMQTHSFTDFVYEVKMHFDSSNPSDCGGISFRNNPKTELQLYYFYICRDGQYGLIRYMDNNHPPNPLLPPDATSNLITEGAGQTYILTVLAQEFNFDIYINQHYVTTATDPAKNFANGSIGVLVRSIGLGTTQASFSDATVWTF